MKLRSKLTLTLLFASLISAAAVGGIAYWLLMRDFSQDIMDQAFRNFHTDVSAYLSFYGSWEEGARNEPFPLFVQRMRADPRVPAGGISQPRHEGSFIDRPPRPPFHFVLLDTDGRVIKHGGPYPFGEMLPETMRREARPIMLDGQVAVLALPVGEPNLSPQDRKYLAAMRQALVTGFLIAGSLAVLLGLLFGRRMSAALDELTTAIRAMPAAGELPQPLTPRSQDEIGDLAMAFNRMSAELNRTHGELRELSIRDALTGLYNRRHFDEQAAQLYQQALRYGHGLTVMVDDLDHFKQINDGFSHAVGDEVLRRVAQLLLQHTRKSDLLARYGGEEFVIAFAETGMEQAAQLCETLRRLIESQPWQEIQAGLRVTISMGLNADLSLGSVDRMLSAADTQLYAAKHAGRNRVEPRLAVG